MTSTSIYPEYPCITEWAIKNFKPTWLMIKRHRITGLFYFCKTVGKDPIGYPGSGTYWIPHIEKHGKQYVETVLCQLFTDIYLLVKVALTFSKEANIVESKEWANLIPEDGLNGGQKCKTETKRPLSGCCTGDLLKEMGKRAVTEIANAKRKATCKRRKHQQGKNHSQYGLKFTGIHKGNVTKKVKSENLENYLADGWSLGYKEKKIKQPKPRISKKQWTIVVCVTCNKQFEASQRDIKRGRKFCSSKCCGNRK